jgi:hypothetical protein
VATINKWARGAVAFSIVLAISGAAAAKQEAMSASLREAFPASLLYVNQISAPNCADAEEAAQSEMCASAEMRLRLCEKGLDAEPALSPVVYQCFLRSQ